MTQESRLEGSKQTLIEMPDFWFDAIYEGNAQFPQSNAGIGTFLLDALIAARTPMREIQSLGTPQWCFSSRQKEILIKGLNAMHARYAVRVASAGQGEFVEGEISKQHGSGKRQDIRELEEDRFESFAQDTLKVAYDLFNSLLDTVLSSLKEPRKDGLPIVSAWITHAACLLRQDSEAQVLLTKHKELLRDVELAKPVYDPDRLNAILQVRKDLARVLLPKLRDAMKNEPVLATYEEEIREEILTRLEKRYGMLLELGV